MTEQVLVTSCWRETVDSLATATSQRYGLLPNRLLPDVERNGSGVELQTLD